MAVDDPKAPKPAPSTPTLATPTVIPGHDAAAVAAKDMTFAAGNTLAASVPISFGQGLEETPGWRITRNNVDSGTDYTSTAGCIVSAKTRTKQRSLSVAGDDNAATAGMFAYLDSSVLPEYLKTAQLRWGGDDEKPGKKLDVLALETKAAPPVRASVVYARVFSQAESTLLLSISCPTDAALAAAKGTVIKRMVVQPPAD
ncbi:hypothetical protein [Pseudarthrobacter sp. J1763]|uniref:hypothetical protein n=1 Tax=Pseudarthrobacter sp. J1763 TaxID=3420445 RepID=UPI003D276848